MLSLRNQQVPCVVHLHHHCKTCRRYHDDFCRPEQVLALQESWTYKHSRPGCLPETIKVGHRIGPLVHSFLHRAKLLLDSFALPWWLRTWDFQENNNFQLSFNASSNLTITSFNSLASDTNLLAGASSAVVDNGASLTLLDVGITGAIKSGTTPTAGEGDGWVWSTRDDTPTYPDAITGSDAAITLTSSNVKVAALNQWFSFVNDTNSNRVYDIRSTSLQAICNGFVPRKWGVWFVHSMVAALNASGHQMTQKQSYVAG